MNEYTITQITNNNSEDLTPKISGNNIVWRGGNIANPDGVFLYNGNETTQLAESGVLLNLPNTLSDNTVGWVSAFDERGNNQVFGVGECVMFLLLVLTKNQSFNTLIF